MLATSMIRMDGFGLFYFLLFIVFLNKRKNVHFLAALSAVSGLAVMAFVVWSIVVYTSATFKEIGENLAETGTCRDVLSGEVELKTVLCTVRGRIHYTSLPPPIIIISHERSFSNNRRLGCATREAPWASCFSSSRSPSSCSPSCCGGSAVQRDRPCAPPLPPAPPHRGAARCGPPRPCTGPS